MKKLTLAAMAAGALMSAFAQNPIIQTCFTPDPAPYVHGDTVYLFIDRDEPAAQYFHMKDWLLFSTTDMVNWTYRGTPMSTRTFKWAKQGDNAWATQAIERDGKWYWYICAEDTTKGLHGIGVGVADHPDGPYTDALGHPLVPAGWGYIDPSVFIDDDGQAYLFWGNNGLWYAKLGKDMISLTSPVTPVAGLDDEKCFGPKVMKMDYQENRRKMKTGYEEGPWVFKRNGLYYLVYAAGGVPEHMAYSTSKSIDGPWEYRGRILGEAEGSFTIHGGSIEIDGRNFIFYHNGMLPNGGGFRRSACVEEFEFNPDGTIPFINFTKEGVKRPLRNLDPYQWVEAETMADSYGLTIDRNAGTQHHLTSINNGDWMRLRSVDFGKGATKIEAVTAMPGAQAIEVDTPYEMPAQIEVRLDNLGGKVIATIYPQPSKSGWAGFSAPVSEVEGVHDVYFLFKGGEGDLFTFDKWRLKK